MHMVHSWEQHLLGLVRMKVEWLCVMAKAELRELPPTGFIEEQPLGQYGLCDWNHPGPPYFGGSCCPVPEII